MRELHTERLLLRTPRERDAAEIMAIRNSAFVMKNNVMEVFDKEQMVHLICSRGIFCFSSANNSSQRRRGKVVWETARASSMGGRA